MWIDPIVEELHRWREDHAARFQHDLHAIAEDLRQLERDWPAPKVDPPSIRRERQAETPNRSGTGCVPCQRATDVQSGQI